MASEAEIIAEARQVRRLQIVVGLALKVIAESGLTVDEASELVAAARHYALTLFPDKGETYDMIYGSRFKRLMTEKFKLQ